MNPKGSGWQGAGSLLLRTAAMLAFTVPFAVVAAALALVLNRGVGVSGEYALFFSYCATVIIAGIFAEWIKSRWDRG